MKRLLPLFLFAALCAAQAPTSSQIKYTYTLPADFTNVSIGVKDTSGNLIRTLWAGHKNAGTYSAIWDGNDDIGRAATNGPFSIVVLYGNPVYQWDGLIGNTSQRMYGMDRWNPVSEFTAGQWPYAMKLTSANGIDWMSHGGSEGTIALFYMKSANPNDVHIVMPTYVGQNIGIVDLANDGNYIYAASDSVWLAPSWSFATKFDARTGQPAFFSGVAPTRGANFSTPNWPGTVMTSIDVQNSGTTTGGITAIAVQRSGNLLAVGHGNIPNCTGGSICTASIATNNTIKFFDKNTGLTTGIAAPTYTITNPQHMGFDPAGNLWVLANGVVTMISNPGTATASASTPLSGLANAVALDVNSASGGHVYVLDGGSSQQLKEFDPSTYALVRTYGVLGGYTDCNPTVAHNRLFIDATPVEGVPRPPDNGPVSWVKAEPNGDVWIGDAYMPRIQHLTPNGITFNYVNQIIFAAETYHVAIDKNDPTRIFHEFWEYKIDYTVPNNSGDPDPASTPAGNGSWTLVKNWAVGQGNTQPTLHCGNNSTNAYNAIGRYVNGQISSRQSDIMDVLAINGHTYASLHAYNNAASAMYYIVELPSSGTDPARFATDVTAKLPGNSQPPWDKNGNIRSQTTTSLTYYPVSIDASNNPQYGTIQTLVPAWTANTNWQPPITNSSVDPTTGGIYGVSLATPSVNNLVNVGAPTFSTSGAKFSYAASAFADTKYMQFNPQIIATDPGSSWTVEAWLKTTGAGPEAAISYGDNATANFWIGNSAGHFAVSMNGGTGALAGILDSGFTINDGNWHHCAMVVLYDTTVTLFVDGIARATFTGGMPNVSATANYGAIGRAAASTGLAWSGSIDEVAVWNNARYISTFTVPTAAYTGAEPRLNSLWHLDNNYAAAIPTSGITSVVGATGASNQMHIGGVQSGRTFMTFSQIPELCAYTVMPMPTVACGNSNNVFVPFAIGRNLFYAFCQQGAIQAPQNFHYWEDGMFVGTFDLYVTNDWHVVGANSSRIAGYNVGGQYNPTLGYRGYIEQPNGWDYNCVSGAPGLHMTSVNGDAYLYTSSEQNYSPIQRWHISNLASIHEIASPPANLGSTVVLSINVFAAQALKKAARNTLRRRQERRDQRQQERREDRHNN